MKHPTISRYLTLALLLASIGISHADFLAGVAAFERKDYATALREFRPLAEQGDVWAQYNLGSMYYKGHGVAQDYIRAHLWFNLAASNADDIEQRDLSTKARDIVAEEMTIDAVVNQIENTIFKSNISSNHPDEERFCRVCARFGLFS